MSSEFTDERARWGSFVIDGDEHCGFIRLAQKSRKSFELDSSIRYEGATGLEDNADIPPESIDQIRFVSGDLLAETDLASVPSILRWFISPYGVHTPAALIHDYLIGGPKIDGITDQSVDRYFRFMLEDLGVRFIRRWLMWAAVAFRTRYEGGTRLRASLIVWVVAAVLGTVGLVSAVLSGTWWLAIVLLLAPIPLSGLWGPQYGAGLIAAYFAVPWVLPPTVLAGLFYVIYRVAEYLVGVVGGRDQSPGAGTEPLDYHYL